MRHKGVSGGSGLQVSGAFKAFQGFWGFSAICDFSVELSRAGLAKLGKHLAILLRCGVSSSNRQALHVQSENVLRLGILVFWV